MALSWTALVTRSEEELASLDIAEVNLACADGLPGAEKIDVQVCINRLDYFSRRVKQFTDAQLKQFRRKRYDYHNSEAYFRMLALVTVLQRDMGVRYNPWKIPTHVPLDVEDTFIHGVLLGDGGTCASLPVVYVAVGRRLGYPLKLVHVLGDSTGHRFARWDEGKGGERFNIDVCRKGFSMRSDDEYRTGRYARTARTEVSHGLLKSLTAKQELSAFLTDRAFHWRVLRNHWRHTQARAWAYALQPNMLANEGSFAISMNEWKAYLDTITPPGFVDVIWHMAHARRLPVCVRRKMEKDMFYLQAMHAVLHVPEFERQLWAPMRQGQKPPRLPARAHVYFNQRGGCEVELEWPGDRGRIVWAGLRADGRSVVMEEKSPANYPFLKEIGTVAAA